MTTKEEFLTDKLSQLNIDIDWNCLTLEDTENFDDLMELLEDNDLLNVDIIYYSNAIDYLKEHDTSLNESLSLASELGYSTENLNSELLASLLATQNLREEFEDLSDEIGEIFDNWEEIEADQEAEV